MPAPTRKNVYEAHHHGVWLSGVSIVVADTEDQAMELLLAELKAHGLKTDRAKIMRRLNIDDARCFVLWDGDY